MFLFCHNLTVRVRVSDVDGGHRRHCTRDCQRPAYRTAARIMRSRANTSPQMDGWGWLMESNRITSDTHTHSEHRAIIMLILMRMHGRACMHACCHARTCDNKHVPVVVGLIRPPTQYYIAHSPHSARSESIRTHAIYAYGTCSRVINLAAFGYAPLFGVLYCNCVQ